MTLPQTVTGLAWHVASVGLHGPSTMTTIKMGMQTLTGESFVAKTAKDTIGGWSWWVASYKAAHPEETLDYKTLMQKYIKGETPE